MAALILLELVGLVEEKHAAARVLHSLAQTDRPVEQIRRPALHHIVDLAAQQAQQAEKLADAAGHHRLARAGRAEKDIIAGRAVLLAPNDVAAQTVQKLLDVGKADEGIDPGKGLLQVPAPRLEAVEQPLGHVLRTQDKRRLSRPIPGQTAAAATLHLSEERLRLARVPPPSRAPADPCLAEVVETHRESGIDRHAVGIGPGHAQKNLLHLRGRVIGQRILPSETARKALVLPHKALHLVRVAGQHDGELALVRRHVAHQLIDGLQAVRRGEGVRLVNEQNAAHGLLHMIADKPGRLSLIRGDKIGARALNELPLRQQAKLVIQLADEARHRRFSRSGTAQERKVQRVAALPRRRGERGKAARLRRSAPDVPQTQLLEGKPLPDALLHVVEADKRIQAAHRRLVVRLAGELPPCLLREGKLRVPRREARQPLQEVAEAPAQPCARGGQLLRDGGNVPRRNLQRRVLPQPQHGQEVADLQAVRRAQGNHAVCGRIARFNAAEQHVLHDTRPRGRGSSGALPDALKQGG